MSLPIPLPDDPKKWDGWRNYNSENYYERLCLRFEDNPTDHQIEENCRQLLVWWQKKLPLKNQPSNPLVQMLRGGLDDASHYLSRARSELLNRESRQRLDTILRSKLKERAEAEFHKFLSFSISGGILTDEAEAKLLRLGQEQGLGEEEVIQLIEHELQLHGAIRRKLGSGTGGTPADPAQEFWRLLDLSGLQEEEMTDDQRDALINMAENLGLEPGFAEDMVDDWLEAQEAAALGKPAPAIMPSAPKIKKATTIVIPPPTKKAAKADTPSAEEEKRLYPDFTNKIGMEMIFIPSGTFQRGSIAPGSQANEQPVHRVHLTRYFIARFPVTNELYELFSPAHQTKRIAAGTEKHPVVYVNSLEAAKFCEWLSSRDGRKYRLPTEAEWEYAARGADGRIYPWGNTEIAGHLANFADAQTRFAWRDPNINDGFSETSPVGSYPHGASPFGVEDMAGNVWEWCADFFQSYANREQINPCATNGAKRIYRGGSWRSRFSSLRTTTRGFNAASYSYNDVGFRVVCEAK